MGAPSSLPVQRARRSTFGSRAGRLTAAAAIAAAALAGALATAGVAAAAPRTPAGLSGKLDLLQQSPAWVTSADGLTLSVAVHSAAPASELGIGVTMYSDATARSAFQQTLTGNLAGFSALPPSALIPLDTTGLSVGGGDRYRIRLPVSAPGLSGQVHSTSDGTVLSVPCASAGCAGVYPIQVSLVDLTNGAALDSFTTYLVLTPPSAVSGTDPLDFSWVLSLGSTPAMRADGTPDVDSATLSELDLISSELQAHPSTSLSVELFGQLAEALGLHRKHHAANPGLATLRSLATTMTGAEVVPETYAPVDVSGLVHAGLGSELAAQVQRSRLALKTFLGTTGSDDEYVAGSAIGTSTLSTLASQGISRFVVPTSDVAAPPPDVIFTPMMPFLVSGTGAEAIASYPGLDQHLTGGGNAVLRANQLLADLAVIYFQGPNEPKGVAMSTPVGWDPSPAFMSVVLGGLENSPIVHATTLSELFDHVSPGVDDPAITRRSLEATGNGTGSLPAGAISTARMQLSALESMSPSFNSMPGLEDRLLLAETADLPGSERSAYLSEIGGAFHHEVSLLTLPFGRTITLTSLKSKVPITIFSKATVPLRMRLTVSSPYLGLTVGRTMDVTIKPGIDTITVALDARSSGDFPLTLTLTAPNNAQIAAGRLTIRSTAISGVAIALSIGAVAFLLLWWSRSILQRRRKQHQRRGAELAAQVAPPPPAAT